MASTIPLYQMRRPSPEHDAIRLLLLVLDDRKQAGEAAHSPVSD
jgi:hypothetical protein